ncbi:unnamed protein product [Ophioblennius macclurei]
MSLTVFYSSVTGTTKMKKEQERVFSILESKNIFHIKVDIAQNADDKDRMRNLANDKTALPPQICNGNKYCGNFEAFEDAVECETLEKFLKLK